MNSAALLNGQHQQSLLKNSTVLVRPSVTPTVQNIQLNMQPSSLQQLQQPQLRPNMRPTSLAALLTNKTGIPVNTAAHPLTKVNLARLFNFSTFSKTWYPIGKSSDKNWITWVISFKKAKESTKFYNTRSYNIFSASYAILYFAGQRTHNYDGATGRQLSGFFVFHNRCITTGRPDAACWQSDGCQQLACFTVLQSGYQPNDSDGSAGHSTRWPTTESGTDFGSSSQTLGWRGYSQWLGNGPAF